MKTNTTGIKKKYFLLDPQSLRLSRTVSSLCSGPSLNFATPDTHADSDPASGLCLQQLLMCPCPSWCQCALNTRLNTYSSKTSKRGTAFQIHYGSEVPTRPVEHPMERTANGHSLPHVHFHYFQTHAWNKINWGELKIEYWICWKFLSETNRLV